MVDRRPIRLVLDVAARPGPYILHYGIDWQVKWKDADGIPRDYDFNKFIN